MVKLYVPTADGVPEIVAPDKVIPVGRLPALTDHVTAPVPPELVNVKLYATVV